MNKTTDKTMDKTISIHYGEVVDTVKNDEADRFATFSRFFGVEKASVLFDTLNTSLTMNLPLFVSSSGDILVGVSPKDWNTDYLNGAYQVADSEESFFVPCSNEMAPATKQFVNYSKLVLGVNSYENAPDYDAIKDSLIEFLIENTHKSARNMIEAA